MKRLIWIIYWKLVQKLGFGIVWKGNIIGSPPGERQNFLHCERCKEITLHSQDSADLAYLAYWQCDKCYTKRKV
jgi:hypothetical protein